MKKILLTVARELARHHLSVLVLITVFDIVLIAINENMTVCFSALLPQLLAAYGYVFASSLGYAPLSTIGLALAGLCLVLFLLCMAFSYRDRRWFLCGAGLTAADLAVTIYVSLGSSGYLPDILLHIWIILALVAGFSADYFLHRAPMIKALTPDRADSAGSDTSNSDANSDNIPPESASADAPKASDSADEAGSNKQ